MKLKISRLDNFGTIFHKRELTKGLVIGKIEVIIKHRINLISIYLR